MGNTPGRSKPDVTTPQCDLPVVHLALEAAEQRLALSMLGHPRLSPETALLPYDQVLQQVAEVMPPVWAAEYSGIWAMVGSDEEGPSEGAEISGLTGQGPTTDERQYVYAVTIDTTRFEVRRQSPRAVAHVTGSIEWKLLRAPRSAPMKLSARVGESALEHVRGSLVPHTGSADSSVLRRSDGGLTVSRLDLTGVESSDPTLIGTDCYRLRLVAFASGGCGSSAQAVTSELRGVSRGARGKWDAQLRLKRVATLADQDPDGFYTAIR